MNLSTIEMFFLQVVHEAAPGSEVAFDRNQVTVTPLPDSVTVKKMLKDMPFLMTSVSQDRLVIHIPLYFTR